MGGCGEVTGTGTRCGCIFVFYNCASLFSEDQANYILKFIKNAYKVSKFNLYSCEKNLNKKELNALLVVHTAASYE